MTAYPAVAVQHVRRMRGGTQSQLMRCDDGNYYVVKFQNNPQGTRILANEFLATALAQRLGLPVASGRVVSVRENLIANSEEMFLELREGRCPLQAGLCFGSLYEHSQAWHRGPAVLAAYDFLPVEQLRRVANVSDLAGMLVFDKWTGNLDTRQAVFVLRNGSYFSRMIDHGWCFGGLLWDFLDRPAGGLYLPPVVYETVRGLESFEPWLSRLNREISRITLNDIAREIPCEWYEGDSHSLSKLLDKLDTRRKKVARELSKTRERFPKYFPNWIAHTRTAPVGRVKLSTVPLRQNVVSSGVRMRS